MCRLRAENTHFGLPGPGPLKASSHTRCPSSRGSIQEIHAVRVRTFRDFCRSLFPNLSAVPNSLISSLSIWFLCGGAIHLFGTTESVARRELICSQAMGGRGTARGLRLLDTAAVPPNRRPTANSNRCPKRLLFSLILIQTAKVVLRFYLYVLE